MKHNKDIHVALLYGGVSSEHEISLLSALQVYKELLKNEFTVSLIFISKSGAWYLQKSTSDSLVPIEERDEWLLLLSPGKGVYQNQKIIPLDIAIPITHGKGGEDGILQGLLELIHLPYIGPSPFSSMMGMHKKVAKLMAMEASIPTVPHISFSFYDIDMLTQHAFLTKNIASIIGYNEYTMSSLHDLFTSVRNLLGSSLIIKAEDEGSSVGIEVFFGSNVDEFYETLNKVFTYCSFLLVESFIEDMVEVECGVFKGEHIIASDPEVIANPKTENPHFLNYTQKYFSNTPFSIDNSFKMPKEVSQSIKEYALHISEILLIEGFARVDFFYQKSSNRIYFNEINTIPGLTKTSIYPLLMEKTGYPLGTILTLLIHQKLGDN